MPVTNVISKEGDGFMIAQARLGPGRIHHCMRAIGAAERGLEQMCRRAVSRVTFGQPLATRGNIQDWIAESRIEIEMARLLTLKAAWMMDTVGNRHARTEVAAIKVAAPNVALKVLDRAIQVHGGGGVSDDFGLASAYAHLRTLRLADGPDEVHKLSIARRELAPYMDLASRVERARLRGASRRHRRRGGPARAPSRQGTSEQDLLPLADALDPRRELHVVAPRAPLTLAGRPATTGTWCRGWAIPIATASMPPIGSSASSTTSCGSEPGSSPTATVLGGFSMGTVMSYALGLGPGRPRPAGILAFSGFLPTVAAGNPSSRRGRARGVHRPRAGRPGDRRGFRPRGRAAAARGSAGGLLPRVRCRAPDRPGPHPARRLVASRGAARAPGGAPGQQ